MASFLIDTDAVRKKHQIQRELKPCFTRKGEYIFPLQTMVFDSFSAIKCPSMPLKPPPVLYTYPKPRNLSRPCLTILEKLPIITSRVDSAPLVASSMRINTSAKKNPKKQNLLSQENIVIKIIPETKQSNLKEDVFRRKSSNLEKMTLVRRESRLKQNEDTFVLPSPQMVNLETLDKQDSQRRAIVTKFIESNESFGSMDDNIKTTLDFIEMYTTLGLVHRQRITGIQSKLHIYEISNILKNPRECIPDICTLLAKFLYHFSAKDRYKPIISQQLCEKLVRLASKELYNEIKASLRESLRQEQYCVVLICLWYCWFLVFLLPNQSWYEKIIEFFSVFLISSENMYVPSQPLNQETSMILFSLPNYTKKITPVSKRWSFCSTKTQASNYLFAFLLENVQQITEEI